MIPANHCHLGIKIRIDIDVPPSQLPLATTSNDPGFLHSTSTASIWPSRLSTNGFANIRSILAALSARVRSLARAKGCRRGSKFLEVGAGSPGLIGTCEEGSCCRTDILTMVQVDK